MGKKWAAKRKNVNLLETDVQALEAYCQETGKSEAEVMRDALRRYLKQATADLAS